LRKESIPVVIKADGLAAGKGVTVAETREQAEAAIKEAMVEGRFGEAGKRVVIEECLAGNEVSILAVCSGKDAVLLEPSQDHKRVFEGDRGPNTGGMGAYSPVPGFTDAQKERVRREIILPVLATLHKRGLPYRGVLYAGLMVCSGTDIRVLEFNVRFGDPETQAVLPRMQSDLFTLLDAAARGEALDPASVEWSPDACVTVVAASGGYPGAYENGKEIRGLDAGVPEKTAVFHAGTRKMEGKWLTAGGRVLAVSTMGKNLPAARRGAYRFLETIRFDGMHFRRDIAGRFDPGAGEKASS
jgi:phosphoribosylamine--glycine ligase